MRMQHRLEYWLFLAFRWFILGLPLETAQTVGARLGGAAFHLLTGRRNIALDNLRHAFPEKSETELQTITRGAFRNYGIVFAELLWFPNLNRSILERLLIPKNISLMHEVHAGGNGAVMLAGHFGNWELIALGMAYLSGLPLTIIVQTQNNTLVDKMINRHRSQFGNIVVPKGMSIREILTTMKNGGIVAIAPDQSGPNEGVFVNFFGRMTATHQGPAVFALRCNAPILMGFIIRKDDCSYDVILEIVPSDDLKGDTEENVAELTRRHTALLESYIRKYPDQWLWMHRRWKNTKKETEMTSDLRGVPDAAR